MNNLLNFFEVFVLRDILAFLLPGGISLAGIYIIAQAFGTNRWEKPLSTYSLLESTLILIILAVISFLIGHVWDMIYRIAFQTNETFQGTDIIKKMLTGDPVAESKAEDDHIANQIRLSAGQFINIKDWKKESAKEWVETSSKKAHELSVLLSYWIEEEDPKIYSDEISRPHIQSHFLHVCGMAFCFFAVCVLLGEIICKPELVFAKASLPMWMLVLSTIPLGLALILPGQHKRKILMAFCILGVCILLGEIIWKPELAFVKASLPMWILVLFTILFGLALILQGQHKRKIFVEHVFRVFYVIWRKRDLERAVKEKGIIVEKNKENRTRKT